jgi:hypothetical protein
VITWEFPPPGLTFCTLGALACASIVVDICGAAASGVTAWAPSRYLTTNRLGALGAGAADRTGSLAAASAAALALGEVSDGSTAAASWLKKDTNRIMLIHGQCCASLMG